MVVNRGIKVLVSTHSDYFIREINNLIMLNSDFNSKKDIMSKHGYENSMLLPMDKVSAYVIKNNSINSMKIDEDEGIEADTFDSVIRDLNNTSDKIYYTKMDNKETIN